VVRPLDGLARARQARGRSRQIGGGPIALFDHITHHIRVIPRSFCQQDLFLVQEPNSDFLLSIYNTPLPRGTRHDLVYGSIKGGPFWLKGENDGVVTVESETDLRVKPATSSFKHLLHERVAILNQEETVHWVEGLLAK
jgi:hypothetical protein